MFYFFMRAIINAIAAALVITFVPGLHLAPTIAGPVAVISAYAGIGLIYEILRTLLRPLILFLGGRLYISSMGLLALLTDFFIFMLVSYIAPLVWEVAEARLITVVVGAIAMGVIVVSLQALTGLDTPNLRQQGHSAPYWRWLGMLPTGRRNWIVENLRTRQMVNVLQQYGIEILVGISPLGGVRRWFQRLIFRRGNSLADETPAAKLRIMLQELGPTFVKFGQMVGSRSDILPEEWRLELEKLQDDARPFSLREVEETFQREFGKNSSQLFALFDPVPLAAASTAQVHAATLRTGETVVVKVQRPNIEVTVKGDLNVMQDVLEVVEKRIPWSRRFGFSPLFREFADNVRTELDMTREAYNATLLRHNMQALPDVHVPCIYTDYSSRRILTQERVAGIKISDTAALDAAGIVREDVGIHFFRALLRQLFVDGFFHADPHPGNIWVESEVNGAREGEANFRVIFLDMGLMGALSPADRITLGELIWALQDRDASSVARVLGKLCAPAPSAQGAGATLAPALPTRAELTPEIERMINRTLVFATAPTSMAAMITDLVDLLARHNLHLRKEFTLAVKAIGQGESVMSTLLGEQPMEYILNVTWTQMTELLRTEITPNNLINGAVKPRLRASVGRAIALQAGVSTLMDDFEAGRLLVQLNQSELDRRIGAVNGAVNAGVRLIVISVLVVGLLLGSTLALLLPIGTIPGEEVRWIVRIAAESGFVIGAALAVTLLLVTLWRAIRRSP